MFRRCCRRSYGLGRRNRGSEPSNCGSEPNCGSVRSTTGAMKDKTTAAPSSCGSGLDTSGCHWSSCVTAAGRSGCCSSTTGYCCRCCCRCCRASRWSANRLSFRRRSRRHLYLRRNLPMRGGLYGYSVHPANYRYSSRHRGCCSRRRSRAVRGHYRWNCPGLARCACWRNCLSWCGRLRRANCC
jgi:hypothetical protein